ncbi:MAG TPA: protein O-GlcNAcase [Chloroflexaceae bacterium]|nr:protein O-GlcNAcase [Chloroflexaceae bacterium]
MSSISATEPARASERTSFFDLRGVVEGFYGPPYTCAERDDLIAWMGRRGLNYYLYGPKNDRQHRGRWREPYPAETMAQFGATVRAAEAAGVSFAYALSPSVSMVYSSPDELGLVTAKLGAFYELGVRAFSLFFDDIRPAFRHEADALAYGSFAEAHADVSNRLHAWLRALDPACTLSVCPTDYHGAPPFSPYLHELGARLHPAIDVFYTGREVCAPAIGAEETLAFAAALRRRPLIWDNYPVNDLAMRGELHIGPVRGRDPGLHRAARGVLANPLLQAEASKIALGTLADYLADPHGYDPEGAWLRALDEAAGAASLPALLRFAECSLHSALGGDDAPRLARLAGEALAELRAGADPGASAALATLDAYLGELDEASYHLKNRMGNLALRANLLPWLELCDLWCDMGRRAIWTIGAVARGTPEQAPLRELGELLAEARGHHKRYAGQVLVELGAYALELADARRAA